MILDRLIGVLSSVVARFAKKAEPRQVLEPTPAMKATYGAGPAEAPGHAVPAGAGSCSVCGGPLPPSRPPRIRQGFCSAKCYAKEFRRIHPSYYARYQRVRRSDPRYREQFLGYLKEYRKTYEVQKRRWGPSIECPRCHERGRVVFVSYMNAKTGVEGAKRMVVRHRGTREGAREIRLHCLSKKLYPDLYLQMGLNSHDLRRRVPGEASVPLNPLQTVWSES